MVKSPKTRHSKPKREPVTIDLDPASVSRVSDTERGGAGPSKPDQPGETGAPTGTGAAAGQASAKTAPGAAASAGKASPAGQKEKVSGSADTKSASGAAVTKGTAAETSRPGTGKTEEKLSETGKNESADAKTANGGPAGPSSGERKSSTATPPPARRSGAGAALGAGILGGVAVLVLAGALQWAGVIPTLRSTDETAGQSIDALRQEVVSLRNNVATLNETAGSTGRAGDTAAQRLDGLENDVAGLRKTVSELQSAVSSGGAGENAGLDALETRLSDLEAQVADLGAGQENGDADAVRDRLSEMGQSLQSASSAASAASDTASTNSEQLQSLRDRIAQLSERVETNDRQPQLALVMAASALKMAIERGSPFASELETYSVITDSAGGLDELRPFARTGVPTRAELEAEAGKAASRMIDATEQSDTGGVFDHLMASARSLVTVRPVGETEGDTVPAIAARIEAAVRTGDYEKALREYETLPDEAKAAGGDFAEKLRARRAADSIVDKALSDALKPA